jgi:hypothetical protein
MNNLSVYSKNIILKTFSLWEVPKDFADPMYNYLVHGYSPGSCFTAVLANDFISAVARSHPANTIEAFKALVGWMRDTMPREAYGSYEAVTYWYAITADERRAILEKHKLVYTAKEETFLLIKNDPAHEPVLY